MRATGGHPQSGATRLPQLPAYYYHPHTLDSLYSRVSRYLSRSDHTMQIIVTLSIFSTHFLCLFVHVTLQVVLQDL